MNNAGDTTIEYINLDPDFIAGSIYNNENMYFNSEWRYPDAVYNAKKIQINGYILIECRSIFGKEYEDISPLLIRNGFYMERIYCEQGLACVRRYVQSNDYYEIIVVKNPISNSFCQSTVRIYGHNPSVNDYKIELITNYKAPWQTYKERPLIAYKADQLPRIIKRIETNVPIFEEEVPESYWNTGDISTAININFNNPRLDWVISVNPSYTGIIRISWNTDDIKAKVAHIYHTESVTGNRELLADIDFSVGYFDTTYNAISIDKLPDTLFMSTDNDNIDMVFCMLTHGVKIDTYGIGGESIPAEIVTENDNVSITVRIAGKGKPDVIKPPSPNDPTNPDVPVDITDTEFLERGGDLITTFKITEDQLHLIGQKLWSYSMLNASIFNLSSAPIENIIAVKLMPVSFSGTVTRPIMCGNYETGQSGLVIKSTTPVNIGNVDVPAYYNNFLDYEPYTQCSIYIPFIGFRGLAANYVVGHNISVTYVYDVVTGSCKVTVASDGSVFCEYDGECGIDLPLTSSNRAEVEAAQISSFITSVASKNPLPMLNAATQSPTYESSGSVNSTCAAQLRLKCFVIIDRPISDLPQTYAHDYGMYCGITCAIGDLNGFTACNDNVDLTGIPCTDAEREMIRDYLIGGFYA